MIGGGAGVGSGGGITIVGAGAGSGGSSTGVGLGSTTGIAGTVAPLPIVTSTPSLCRAAVIVIAWFFHVSAALATGGAPVQIKRPSSHNSSVTWARTSSHRSPNGCSGILTAWPGVTAIATSSRCTDSGCDRRSMVAFTSASQDGAIWFRAKTPFGAHQFAGQHYLLFVWRRLALELPRSICIVYVDQGQIDNRAILVNGPFLAESGDRILQIRRPADVNMHSLSVALDAHRFVIDFELRQKAAPFADADVDFLGFLDDLLTVHRGQAKCVFAGGIEGDNAIDVAGFLNDLEGAIVPRAQDAIGGAGHVCLKVIERRLAGDGGFELEAGKIDFGRRAIAFERHRGGAFAFIAEQILQFQYDRVSAGLGV